jgi:cytochrome c-type biogenesis protein CcsB
MLLLSYLALWLTFGAYVIAARRGAGRTATGLALVTWGLLTAGLAQRAAQEGHWPLTSRYEFALGLAWAILAVYLHLEVRWRERRAGAYAMGVALLAATYAVTRPANEQAIAPLLPALRSPWFPFHVLAALIAYGAFSVAAGLGVLLWRRLRVSDKADEPSADAVRWALERTVMLGVPWMTMGLLIGAIWAQGAWGRFWGWDPKESWAFITWLWYLLFLHLRPLPAWRGQRLAALAILGFGLMVFTFIGVPWLVRTVRLESLHGF